MVFKICHYILLLLTILATPIHPDKLLDSSTLVAVNSFGRHGARTPLVNVPQHAQIPSVQWNAEPGTLTKVGRQKMYELGEMLRERYDPFLNRSYVSSELLAITTAVDRTRNSIKALLAGLFKVPKNDFWNNKMPYIPIYTDNNVIDQSVVLHNDNCPLFKAELKFAETIAQQNDWGFENVYEYLSKYSGKKINGMYDVFPIWDNLECMAHNELPLPSWTSPVYPTKMAQIIAKLIRSTTVGSDKMLRITAGLTLRNRGTWCSLSDCNKKEIAIQGVYTYDFFYLCPYIEELHQHFTAASSGGKVKKIIIHGGHDTSMTANLAALNIYEKIVNPGDTILVELHKTPNQQFFVQIFYVKTGGSEIINLPVRNCEHPCPLNRFIELTKDIIPKTWELECRKYY